MFSRAVDIRGDALVVGVVPPIGRPYLKNGGRSVANHLDRDIVFDSPVTVHGPAYRRVRYALGDTSEVHRPLFPRVYRNVRHVAEGGRELDCQMAVLVGDAAGVLRHAFVQTVVVGESAMDRQDADRLAGHVVRSVRHDYSIILRLSAHQVLLIEFLEGHLGRRPAEGLAHNLLVLALHHGLVQELHDLRFNDYVHLDVGGDCAGKICRGALVFARILAVHIGDSEHTRDRIDAKAIGNGEILLSEGLDPCERWRRFASGLALDICILALSDIYRARNLLDRWSCVYLYKNY